MDKLITKNLFTMDKTLTSMKTKSPLNRATLLALKNQNYANNSFIQPHCQKIQIALATCTSKQALY